MEMMVKIDGDDVWGMGAIEPGEGGSRKQGSWSCLHVTYGGIWSVNGFVV